MATNVELKFGELFRRVGFIVTDGRAVVWFYNKRGTAEQRIEGWLQAVKMTRRRCSVRRT